MSRRRAIGCDRRHLSFGVDAMKMNSFLAGMSIAFLVLLAGVAWIKSAYSDDSIEISQVMKDPSILKDGEVKEIKVSPDGEFMKKIYQDQIAEFDKFNAIKDRNERNAYLDQMIDRQEKMLKNAEVVRAEDLKVPAGGGAVVKMEAKSDGPEHKEIRQVIKLNANSAMMDQVPPEFSAKAAEFAKAINDRRAERGLPPAKGVSIIMNKEISR
jgi:hypothetical protein